MIFVWNLLGDASEGSNHGGNPNDNQNDLNDSDVDEIQNLLQSSDSDIQLSDEELPRPKKLWTDF